MHRTAILLAGLCLPVLLASDDEQETYRVFLLKRQAGEFVIEPVEVRSASSESRSFECSAESGIIDVILPVGPGGAASITDPQAGRRIKVVCAQAEVRVTESLPDGSSWTRPTRSLGDLARHDVRVSVTGDDGLAQAFLIRENRTVTRDEVGPVVDLFAGKVPLPEGGCAMFTETYATNRGVHVAGESELWIDRWPLAQVSLEDGRTGMFLVDIGAGTTVVAQEFLPEGQVIEEAKVMQFSSQGRRALKYAPEGATGAVQSIVGYTTLPLLKIGGIQFENAAVDVMKGLSAVLGIHIDGILGLDLLGRTGLLSLELGGASPSMRMTNEPRQPGVAQVELPLALIRSHIVVDGFVGGSRVSFILDTGAPDPFLDEVAATAAGVGLDAASEREGHGLDGGSVAIRASQAAALTFGGRVFEDVRFQVSALPVFSSLRGGNQNVGLLGVSFLARFERVDIDLDERVVRFVLP